MNNDRPYIAFSAVPDPQQNYRVYNPGVPMPNPTPLYTSINMYRSIDYYGSFNREVTYPYNASTASSILVPPPYPNSNQLNNPSFSGVSLQNSSGFDTQYPRQTEFLGRPVVYSNSNLESQQTEREVVANPVNNSSSTMNSDDAPSFSDWWRQQSPSSSNAQGFSYDNRANNNASGTSNSNRNRSEALNEKTIQSLLEIIKKIKDISEKPSQGKQKSKQTSKVEGKKVPPYKEFEITPENVKVGLRVFCNSGPYGEWGTVISVWETGNGVGGKMQKIKIRYPKYGDKIEECYYNNGEFPGADFSYPVYSKEI